ncbi:MarR family winged helix-turn-helix transcriptional regulator [Nocardioides sp.]|uniref:MarR family winged helix-turn-helix transcriptional regulator n=1 Tax=Nocardioides sp. TaxID=35761 RepID=UPI003D14F002
MSDTGTRWLSADEQHSWRAFVLGSTLLMDQLDQELRRDFRISLTEYEILVRLSERPDRVMRMAQLADAVCHSRSRVTHTISRMEKAGLVVREDCLEDGRGVQARMTDEGFALLERAAPAHVEGVRHHFVDACSPDDFAVMGRVMNAVTDRLIGAHPEAEIR